MKSNEIWIDKIVSSPLGNVTVSVRIDNAIDPEIMLARLEKESDDLWKRMFKTVNKLDSVSDKTPQKIVDAINKEITDIHDLQKYNMEQYFKWMSL